MDTGVSLVWDHLWLPIVVEVLEHKREGEKEGERAFLLWGWASWLFFSRFPFPVNFLRNFVSINKGRYFVGFCKITVAFSF